MTDPMDLGHQNKKIVFYPKSLQPFLRISHVVDDFPFMHISRGHPLKGDKKRIVINNNDECSNQAAHLLTTDGREYSEHFKQIKNCVD